MKKIFSYLGSILIAFSWVLVSPAMPAKAAADTCTWTGTNSADWSDGGNWSGCDNGGVPENGDSLVFPSGSATTTNNDIAGTLALDNIDVTGDNYVITGNAIEISGYLQFTGNDNNFNMSDMTFANASTGTSLVINGTGNTITNGIGLNMAGGHDFNVYANQDFTAPHFTGGSIGNFNKQGSASLTTAGAPSTFTTSGAVNIIAGSFVCNNSNCGGAMANNIQTLLSGSLVLNGTSISVINHDIFLASTTSPQLNKLPGDVDIDGNIYVNSSGSIYAQTGTLTLNGDIYLDGGNATLNTSSTTTSTIVQDAGSIISDTGSNRSLNIIAGRVQLNGDNTYTGVTNVTGNSVLQITHDNSLGSAAGDTVVESGSVLAATASLTTPEPLQIEGDGVPTIYSGKYEGALVNDGVVPVFTGDIQLTGDATIRSTDGDMELEGSLSGTANPTFVVINGGYISLTGSGSNTYVGTAYVAGGDLLLAKSGGVGITGDINVVATSGVEAGLIVSSAGGNQIIDDSIITLTNDGAAQAMFGSTNPAEVVGTVVGDGHLEADGGGTGFTIGGGDKSGTFSGTIDNEGGTITKTGSGTWTLDGVTQPDAGTTFNFVVDGGKIVWNSAVSGASIAVNTGGTLKGNGAAGITTINTGGTLAAGNSPGCITVSNLTLSAGSTFEEEIAGGTACTEYDRTNVNGNATLGGANLSVVPSYSPAAGTTYVILETTNGNVIGTFNGLADGATFSANGIEFRINYTNNQVILTVLGGSLVPTGQNQNGVVWFALAALMIGAAGMGFALKRNRLSIKRSAL